MLYDVFISYSHKNGEWVWTWLVPRLKRCQLKVLIDKESFAPGEPLLKAMERAVVSSRKTLLILTSDYVASGWGEFEGILAQSLDPAANRLRIIPLLLEPCEIPLRVRNLTYIDFREPGDWEGRLLVLVKSLQMEVGESVSPRWNKRILEVQPLRMGELLLYTAFLRREFITVSKSDGFTNITVPVPDVITYMWSVCKEIDVAARRSITETYMPIPFTRPKYKLEFRGGDFEVTAVCKYKGWILSPLGREFAKNYSVIFTIRGIDQVLDDVISRFKQRYDSYSPTT